MKDKILLPNIRSAKSSARDTLIRLDADVFDAIGDLSYKTAMSKKDIASLLIRDALSRVELVERKVYEMHLADNEGEEE